MITPTTPAAVIETLRQIQGQYAKVHKAAFSAAPVALNDAHVEMEPEETIAAAKMIARIAAKMIEDVAECAGDDELFDIAERLTDEVATW